MAHAVSHDQNFTNLIVDYPRDALAFFAPEEDSDWRQFSPCRLSRYCLDMADMFDADRVVPVTIFLGAAGRARSACSSGASAGCRPKRPSGSGGRPTSSWRPRPTAYWMLQRSTRCSRQQPSKA